MKEQLKSLSFSFDWNRVNFRNLILIKNRNSNIYFCGLEGASNLPWVLLQMDTAFVPRVLQERTGLPKRSKQ